MARRLIRPGAPPRTPEVEFDFEKSDLFPMKLLRRHYKSGEILQIETLWFARGSGLLVGLASICALEVTGQIMGMEGMREANVGRAITCLRMVSYSVIDFSGCNYFVGDLSKVQWPAELQVLNLAFCKKVEGDLGKVQWPATLQSLNLSYCKKVDARSSGPQHFRISIYGGARGSRGKMENKPEIIL
eukprot:g5562.t1